MDKEKAKQEIKKLIDDFRFNYQRYKKELEANTETKLVEPLFQILGWAKNDFIKREKAHRGEKSGFADYAFYIGDKIVFFLEAKKIGIPLEKEANKQVISYALSRKVPLAISTNFEQMNIFCVEQENALKNVFRCFRQPEDYITNFADLWFLSKESFEQGLLLKKAEDEGRLKRRISIDKPLLEDFMRIRSLIANDIEKNYPAKYNINEKDEIIQRIIDRLIFIRRSEDVGINPDNLTLEEIKHLPGDKAYPRLKHIFSNYDDKYNSGLFTPNKDNDCDKITIDGEIIKKLVYYLYESHDKEYIYNFEWIDADVLGQVYEQYLCKILAQTKSGKAKLKEGQAHRKEQGIYYTPTYIVDYIVKNTVCELLKDKKVAANKIKILDPACGSGSFLIKAFDYMQKHLSNDETAKQHRLDSQGSYSIKTEILKNNIFGVDLDNKAVEITKLNLLLKTAEKFRKLPKELDDHICWGNSLIEDDSISEHAFKWVGDFQEGTFDVVIGNPPYVSGTGKGEIKFRMEEIKFYKREFKEVLTSHMNLFVLFVCRSLNLLKEGGLFGFIIPNFFLTKQDFKKFREYILENCEIIKILDFGTTVFENSQVPVVILLLRKKKGLNKTNVVKFAKLRGDEVIKLAEYNKIPQKEFENDKNKGFLLIVPVVAKLLKKIENKHLLLADIAYINYGVVTGKNTKYILNEFKTGTKRLVKGGDIGKYSLKFSNLYVLYDELVKMRRKEIYIRVGDKKVYENPEKILIKYIGDNIIGTLDEERFYPERTACPLVVKSKELQPRYLLALLNSRLLNFYYKNKFIDIRIQKIQLEQLPIAKANENLQKQISVQVKKMLSLNKQLHEIGDKKTAQTAKLEEEIRKTDAEIDELVYKIYGITAEEKKIIEESLK